jgi:hypothetical protein
MEHASTMAEMEVDILFSEGDPFKGKVNKDSLLKEIQTATLKKLVIEDSDFLTEEEFQACLENAKKNSN